MGDMAVLDKDEYELELIEQSGIFHPLIFRTYKNLMIENTPDMDINARTKYAVNIMKTFGMREDSIKDTILYKAKVLDLEFLKTMDI